MNTDNAPFVVGENEKEIWNMAIDAAIRVVNNGRAGLRIGGIGNPLSPASSNVLQNIVFHLQQLKKK